MIKEHRLLESESISAFQAVILETIGKSATKEGSIDA